MEKFYEQIVTREFSKSRYNLLNTLNAISKAMLLFFMGFLISFIIPLSILCLVTFISLEIYLSKCFIEFEYEFLEDQITIRKIIAKRKSRTLALFRIADISKASTNISNINKKDVQICTIEDADKKLMQILIYAPNTAKIKGNLKNCYLMGVDDKLFSILKKYKSNIFNHI